MDKPLPDWIRSWLNRPGWQLLMAQWLLLAGLVVLSGALLVYGEWQQREHLRMQQQRLEQLLAEHRLQLSRLPALEELQLNLQHQTSVLPVESENFGSKLYRAGGVLLRWQQQPAQQVVKLQLDYPGLLHLLEGLSPTSRVGQMAVEKQAGGLITQLTLLTPEEERSE